MHRGPGHGGGGGGTFGIRSSPGGVLDGKIAGLYDLEETLGRGHFAVVKLARHVFTGEKVAVKVIDKSKLDQVSKAHLFQEVRCMKLVQHPNVVRLYEVIDTATKLYLILELGDGGDLYDYIMRHEAGLSEELARGYFRQIVRAISYCHRLHVVHRDLKPENVVFFEKLGVVKLTDFGFSNRFCPGQKLETSCGSLAYSAPEILLGDSYDAPAVDVWSLGVILYMLVCGQAPFQEANDSETLTMIMDCKYTVPAHISKDCKNLIARMLVRDPEKRATLAQIAAHAWLAEGKDDQSADALPLVSREQLTEDDHNLIVQKIVNGNIATKEEIQESLDKDAYNHITATYFLLAERKLKSRRSELPPKGKRPDNLAVPQGSPAPIRDVGGATGPNPCLLTVPRTPGDIPQRSRKCSIVQEDEEEEDDLAHSGREELGTTHSLNRRGSRSEGRLNIAIQERLNDVERRKPIIPAEIIVKPKIGKSASIPERNSPVQINIIPDDVTTSILTESSTVSIPVLNPVPYNSPIPKYKTMPSPSRTPSTIITSPLQLNEIFEEGDGEPQPRTSAHFVNRNQKRTSYEQRRSKFHKTRTASCSSSDASDDDSESRKKRAHKLGTSDKPLRGRRDSHDDSSDSQEPGTGGATTGSNTTTILITQNNVQTTNSQSDKTNGTTNTDNTRKKGTTGGACVLLGRRHKSGRRRGGETRLRESQSLNRITEVQEDLHPVGGAIVTPPQPPARSRGLGARLLQGLSMKKGEEKVNHVSRKEAFDESDGTPKCAKEESKVIPRGTLKKMRLLGKYLQVHKRLCIPLPGLFARPKLYKTQSCGALARDRVTSTEKRANSVVRNSIGDINQNGAKLVHLDLTGLCATHLLPHASKCCSFC